MKNGKAGFFVVIGVIATIALISVIGAQDYSTRDWNLKAQNALVIGGYSDNFNYSGENVRPLIGTATVDVDSAANWGTVMANVRTTAESGPIRFSKDVSLTGDITVVMRDFNEEAPYMKGGIAEFLWLHGDTGQGTPVMPRQFTFLAGWGRVDVYVNGELRYPGLEGHFMYTEQARRGAEDGYKVMRSDGTLYSPRLADKTRFTNSSDGELHIVVHSPTPDEGNFPQQSQWMHLNFADVFIKHAPANLSVSISS
ncbi:MAG: hypothetical protein DRH37_10605 [Deltaproteobacteria bacterium]|nr:MAG: hypothetical protein DRH37_10605 [Deltaproteobacteria bacterium]